MEMRNNRFFRSAFFFILLSISIYMASNGYSSSGDTKSAIRWRACSVDRPEPPRVEVTEPGSAPSDAVVLFNGEDMSQWRDAKGNPSPWKIVDGALEVVPGKGDIYSQKVFGDIQMHVEWSTPTKITNAFDAGNSGIKFMGLYEIQIFDSWTTRNMPDSFAGAVYGQHPPLVNACLEPGEWQSFDIIWHRPHFTEDGQVEKPAFVTVLHNGVLVQDHAEVLGKSFWVARPVYEPHAEKLPILLQDHGVAVRYRNIWVREMSEDPPVLPPPLPKEVSVAPDILDEYAGKYGYERYFKVERNGPRLRVRFGMSSDELPWFWIDVIAVSENHFVGTDADMEFTFKRNEAGEVEGFYWKYGGLQPIPYFKRN